VEPATIATKALQTGGVSLTTTRRFFNATLALFDCRGLATPYLAQSLPQLRGESWRVLDDGRMETTYQLKSGITWHDGTPLSVEDFVFAWRVYAAPELGLAGSPPISQIGEVVAPDARTVLIR
jgi:ABC-type transport system substrate-binding protein